MADQIPLILNTSANQIQEMPAGDTLDLTGSNINGVGILTVTTIDCNGDLDVDGHINFDNLSIAGVSTFTGAITANGSIDLNSDLDVDGHTNLDNVNVAGVTTFAGVIEGVAGQNKIPSLYNAMGDLPNPGTYHGMFAHVHSTGRGYFSHAGGWYELVNKESTGVVGTGTESYNVGNIIVGSGVTIESNGQATFTGIVTFGSSSTTIEGDNNVIKVGTALTLGHTQGVQFHTQNLHSAGFEVNQINASGIITASSLSVSGSASIGGVLTYEDVTSIDSVGIITARSGVVTPNVDVDDFISVGSNIHLGNAGIITASSYRGDGSQLTGISVGITTEALVKTNGQTATLDLSKDDHKVTATGTVTIDTTGGTEADSHTLRIVNNGTATINFSSKFLFPSGGTPNLPTATGAISLISFTVHQTTGTVKLLAGASVNFS